VNHEPLATLLENATTFPIGEPAQDHIIDPTNGPIAATPLLHAIQQVVSWRSFGESSSSD
jgi:hypothetical protein